LSSISLSIFHKALSPPSPWAIIAASRVSMTSGFFQHDREFEPTGSGSPIFMQTLKAPQPKKQPSTPRAMTFA